LPIRLFLLLLVFSETVDRESLRFAYSAEQGFDTSCGLTALACLMDRYWGVRSDEVSLARDFLAERFVGGDFTVSFADMTAILKAKGFSCRAFQMNFGQFEKAVARYAPVIVHYDRPEGHFALVLAVRNGSVLTADPAEGTISREQAAFESRWSGNVMLAALPGRAVNTELIEEAKRSVWGRGELLERAALAGVEIEGW
jgi:predicted double-glycine peptidase